MAKGINRWFGFLNRTRQDRPRRSRSLRVESLEGRDLFVSTVFLDASFGTSGKVTDDFPVSGDDDSAAAVALQSDGKIVVAGTSSGDFAVARYTSTGTPDTTFSSDGNATTSLGGSDFGQAVAIQSDGKIIVAGKTGNTFAVVRYTSSGGVDTSFGVSGIAKLQFSSVGAVFCKGVGIQSDGRIVVVGFTQESNARDFAIARFTSSGGVDTSFSSDGMTIIDMGSTSDYGLGVSFESNGKLLIGGTTFVSSTTRIAVVRLNTNGSVDTTYGTNGKTIDTHPLPDRSGFFANRLSNLSDGFIYAVGYDFASTPNRFGVIRGKQDGTVDNTFDGDGFVTSSLGSGAEASGIVRQPDGKLIVVGKALVGSDNDFAMVRYGVKPTIGTFSVPSTAVEQRSVTLVGSGYVGSTSNPTDYAKWFVTGPNGFIKTSSGGTFSFIPPQAGTYQAILGVRDAVGVETSRSATITVIDDAPTITKFEVPAIGVETKPVSLSAAATNALSGSPTQNYKWTVAGPSGFSETLTTADASFTPPAVGNYTVTLTATDSLGGSVTRSQVVRALANVPRIARMILPTNANEGTIGVLNALAYEAGTTTPVQAYQWTITSPSGVATTFETAKVRIKLADSGVYPAELIVFGIEEGKTATKTATFTVNNVAPTITIMDVPTTAKIVRPVNLSATATDPAGALDKVTYAWVITGPGNYRKTFAVRAPVWTTPALTGTYKVTLTVKDKDGGISSLTKSINITI